ncbi:putative LOC100569746 [Trichonephila clavipes]|nr:putative LOC100569746 [Trichonephila clavipes]
MITNFFIPELNNHDVQELWFQQDGATCHTAPATIDLLKDTFGDRLISRFGPVNWPPRSCDFTPLDYFLWGYVKSLVYADKPQTLDHLEDNIRRVIADYTATNVGKSHLKLDVQIGLHPAIGLDRATFKWLVGPHGCTTTGVRELFYVSNPRARYLDRLTPSLPVPTDDVVSRVFIESSSLEQVVAIHSGMAAEPAGLVSSQAKPVEVKNVRSKVYYLLLESHKEFGVREAC